MPITESLQLARALADKHSRRLTDVEDWRPLLAFAQGNPMTLTVVARQALREGLKTKEQIEAFVARLRSGEAAFPDEISEGRSRSLGASLAYGFEQAFNEEEQKKLALLHLFQGFVNVAVLLVMGDPELSWCLPEVRGLTREEGISLLDRAAEVGLLGAHGGGYYSIHPALPWFFKSLFERSYDAAGLAAVRAFVEAIGALGVYYHNQYEAGRRGVLDALRAEEANFLHACRLARAYGWWDLITSAMKGLEEPYYHTGRRTEWKRLVEELVPDLIDPKDDGPLPGREEVWAQVTLYRVMLAGEERQWAKAERFLAIRLDRDRQRASPVLARSEKELESVERQAIHAFMVSLHWLGEIRRKLGRVDCVPVYEEVFDLCERMGDNAGARACAFNLGNAFKELPALHDLDQAEHWFLKSLELHGETDWLGRGRCLGALGAVASERFFEVQATLQNKAEFIRHLSDALRLYHESLEVLPIDAVNELAVIHNDLGSLYGEVGDIDRSLHHLRKTLHFDEAHGELYGAALTRFNIANSLLRSGRQADALEYAEAALLGFESYGERAKEMIERTRGLIAEIRGG